MCPYARPCSLRGLLASHDRRLEDVDEGTVGAEGDVVGLAEGLDGGQLAACRATPRKRNEEAVEAARASAQGWRGGGIGLGQAALPPGESARLFPEPPSPNLVLPGLPDLSRRERGALEYELMGLTVFDHPTAIFPTPAEERLARLPRNGRRGAQPINFQPCAVAHFVQQRKRRQGSRIDSGERRVDAGRGFVASGRLHWPLAHVERSAHYSRVVIVVEAKQMTKFVSDG